MHARVIRLSRLVVALLAFVAATPARTLGPQKDIHYDAEHLAEAVQDACYFSLPLPSWRDADIGSWKPVAAVGLASIDGGFADTTATILTVGAERAWNPRWRTLFLSWFDEAPVRGGSSENLLASQALLDVPLQLPARAAFTGPSGTIRHWGAGAIATRRTGSGNHTISTDLIAGLMVERLDLRAYQIHYRLLEGADAGVEGTLDHSGSNDFATPMAGVRFARPLGGRFAMSLHVILGMPRPVGDFSTRLTGPGFDLTTASTGAMPEQIGDAFSAIGFVFFDRRTGLGIDLGSTIMFPAFEAVQHEGIDRAILLSVSWHKP